MKKILLYTALIVMLAGCASEQESLAPPPDEMSYKDMTCAQLAQEQHRLAAGLAAARDAQRGSLDLPIGGSFGGVPVSGLSGGNVSQVDKIKDQLQALQQAASMKNCSEPPNPYLDDSSKTEPSNKAGQ